MNSIVKHPPQFYRTRKALLFLPLLFIPLLALLFWNLNHQPNAKASGSGNILNTSLPGAKFDKHQKAGNKMSFYDQATQDSSKAQSDNNNPLLQKFGFKTTPNSAAATHNSPLTNGYADPNVIKINQKLADINKEISQPQPAVATGQAAVTPQDKAFTQQVTKLETMMKAMNGGEGPDPQMQQLTKMLAQIQDIQHPEQVKIDTKPAPINDNPFKALPAVVDGNQKILQGGAVKLRLSDSLSIKGIIIPKGSTVYGTATITNQRLLVDIKNIRLDNNIIPVGLTVYDHDGMPGVPAPEAELTGAAGDGANNAIESMQLLSMDQNLATQAAAGGIEAAKGLFSKKIKRIKVHLKNGYPVLLRNNHL